MEGLTTVVYSYADDDEDGGGGPMNDEGLNTALVFRTWVLCFGAN